ncbi:MAG: GlxA family transcriptional regulator [Candidatus Binatia bacterium]
MKGEKKPINVSLLAIPEVMASTLIGLYEVLNSFTLLNTYDDALPTKAPFNVEIVALHSGAARVSGGMPIQAARSIDDVESTDVIIVPSVIVEKGEWHKGRYPSAVGWLTDMYAKGAQLCSTCSGALLLAETGLLEGKEATIHWIYAPTFKKNFPGVRLRLEKTLVAIGEPNRLIMSGASTSWHDLILYLISQHVGPTAAQGIARFFAFQWHSEGLAPYVMFEPAMDHGDAIIQEIQKWLTKHFSVASPIEQAARQSGISERSFKRRFKKATGHTPIDYVQRLRVDEAKRRLERTDAAVDEIGWQVGYEDPTFFRRLFKRVTGVTASAYRRRFRFPDALSVAKA